MTYLEQYYEAINQKKIIVGFELKQLLDKLIDDLNNDEYEYDTSEAYLRMEFIEKFCKHTQDPFTGQPFLLMLWEKAFIEVVYSFKVKATGYDRFKKILLLIARKNGKSTLCAALCMAELMIGEGKSLVCASNNDEQAKIIFDEVSNMARLFDPNLKKGMMRGKYIHINITNIKNKISNNLLKRLTDRQKSGLGRNLNFVIIDESNQLVNGEMPSQLIKGTSIKKNAKLINITTEGVVFDGYLDKELKKSRKIISGEREDVSAKSTLVWLYTMDNELEIWNVNDVGDIDHPCVWQKANPSLYEVKQPQYIVEQIAESKVDKSERMQTLIYDFNIKQNSSERWLLEDDVTYIQDEVDLEQWRKSYCLAAVDLSATTDLTNCKILLMNKDDNKKYVYSKYFIPETKLQESDDKSAGAKYEEWARDGYIDVHEGIKVDLEKVAEWFKYLWDTYEIEVFKLGYDQRFAKDFLNTMETYGYGSKKDEVCEMINQSKYTMSLPMKIFEAELKAKNIHGFNEVDKWCLLNTCIKIDNQQYIMPIKATPSGRIDGAVVFIILFAILDRYRTEFMQKVNERM